MAQSYATDIRPLFRDQDRQCMVPHGIRPTGCATPRRSTGSMTMATRGWCTSASRPARCRPTRTLDSGAGERLRTVDGPRLPVLTIGSCGRQARWP